MNKYLIYILVLSSSIISCNRKDFISEEIKKYNTVNNYSSFNNINKYIYISLNELKLDSIEVNIYNIPQIFKVVEDNKEYYLVRGFIYENDKNNSYDMFLNDNFKEDDMLLTISHEMIHLKQYNDNRLKVTEYGIIFDSLFYFTEFIEYKKRPWEIEAFAMQDSLFNKLNP